MKKLFNIFKELLFERHKGLLPAYTPGPIEKILRQLCSLKREILHTERRASRAEEEKEVIEQELTIEPLTGLLNLKGYARGLHALVSDASRAGDLLWILRLDLDDFKRINDEISHKAGDNVLIGAARIMMSSVRASDLCVRIGGDELLVVVRGPQHFAEVVGERILTCVENELSTDKMRVTMSAGMASFDPVAVDVGINAMAILAQPAVVEADSLADARAINAKGNGKNQLMAPGHMEGETVSVYRGPPRGLSLREQTANPKGVAPV